MDTSYGLGPTKANTPFAPPPQGFTPQMQQGANQQGQQDAMGAPLAAPPTQGFMPPQQQQPAPMGAPAQGLASLGRNGDSTLMHVNNQELQGLQGLAQSQGTSLTTNPQTGLPEAFNLWPALQDLLPAIAAAAASTNPVTAPFAPVIGAGVGAATAAATGGDALTGAISGGVKSYFNPLSNVATSGANLGTTALSEGASNAAAINAGEALPGAITTAADVAAGSAPIGSVIPAETGISALPGASNMTFDNLSKGVGDLFSEGGIDRFQAANPGADGLPMSGMKTAMLGLPFAGAIMEGLTPETLPPLGSGNSGPYKFPAGYKTTDELRKRNMLAGGGILDLANQYHQGEQDGTVGEGGAAEFYAAGGMTHGPGDGMSDSIPATIEGKQQARLADGEFVVPADVVSHIGNGSTSAGAKRLYAMMANIREARTGNSKQGKKVNPDRFLPA